MSVAQKRKRSSAKFYSVRIGHCPGIYNSWDDCLDQVRGYSGATYKAFIELRDAEKFLNGENASDASHRGRKSAKKFYAVRAGRVPGIYTDWKSAQQQVEKWPNPRHKCFASRSEAQRFLDGVDNPQTGEDDHSQSQISVDSESLDASAKRPRTDTNWLNEHMKQAPIYGASNADGLVASTSDMVDGFDNTVVLDDKSGHIRPKSGLQSRATKLQSVQARSDRVVQVYTDGSSVNNGQKGACAGVGVFFGPNDVKLKDISEPLHGPRQTNQRAELTAILRALEQLPHTLSVEIVTDSQYSIKALTQWSKKWQEKDWQTVTGKPVENRDLLESILSRMTQRKSSGAATMFRWTKGHAGNEGNIKADRLAVAGARLGLINSTEAHGKANG